MSVRGARLPIEYRRAVERALREYPKLVTWKKSLDDFAEAIARPCLAADKDNVQGGEAKAFQERVVGWKESNREYRVCIGKIQSTERVLHHLEAHGGGDLLEFIRLRYWDDKSAEEIAWEMSCGIRTVWNLRDRTIECCAPFLIGVWGMAECTV